MTWPALFCDASRHANGRKEGKNVEKREQANCVMPFDLSGLIGPLLSDPTDPVSEEAAARLSSQTFGVAGRAIMLTGERDHNFRIRTDDGSDYLLKISHPAESPATVLFQTGALLHLADKTPGVSVPRIVPTLTGELFHPTRMSRGAIRLARLLTFLPGELMRGTPRPPDLLYSLGQAAARLDQALADFSAPYEGQRELLWDFYHFLRLQPLLANLVGDPIAPLVRRTLDEFAVLAEPKLHRLRQQYIHNDLNPYNVLTTGAAPLTVCGILDFGDMVQAPLIAELAVAASYHLELEDSTLSGLAACVSGYHADFPLTEEEIALLPVFIAARLAMTVLITEWRARAHPENSAYILRNNPAARTGLMLIRELGADKIVEIISAACRESRHA